jgi:DNA mismatch repair ATPase MutL
VRFSFVVSEKPALRFVREATTSISECLCHVFGPSLVAQLESIDTVEDDYLSDHEILSDEEDPFSSPSGIEPSPPQIAPTPRSAQATQKQRDPNKEFQFRIEGFVPKHYNHSSVSVVARSSNDRAFVYVNNRPVDFLAVSKAVTKAYRLHLTATTQRFPFLLINIQLPTHTYDINLTPDKRKVFFHDQDSIVLRLHKILAKIYMLPGALQYFMNGPRTPSETSTQAYNETKSSQSSPSATQPYGQVSSVKSPSSQSFRERLQQVKGIQITDSVSNAPSRIPGPVGNLAGNQRIEIFKKPATEAPVPVESHICPSSACHEKSASRPTGGSSSS